MALPFTYCTAASIANGRQYVSRSFPPTATHFVILPTPRAWPTPHVIEHHGIHKQNGRHSPGKLQHVDIFRRSSESQHGCANLSDRDHRKGNNSPVRLGSQGDQQLACKLTKRRQTLVRNDIPKSRPALRRRRESFPTNKRQARWRIGQGARRGEVRVTFAMTTAALNGACGRSSPVLRPGKEGEECANA